MSEKRTYTEDEIIQALRVCSAGCETCEGCPLDFNECSEDWSLLEREALAVIERQRAEIEELKRT